MSNSTPSKVTLAEKFATFTDVWSPRIVSRYAGHEIRIARAEGAFPWHSHDDHDELFLVIEGELCIDFRDGTQRLCAGELLVVPQGVEHRTRTENGEAKVLIIDPKGTPNTGDEATAFKPVEV